MTQISLNYVFDSSESSYPTQGGEVFFVYHEYTHFINTKHDIPYNFAIIAAANYIRGSNVWLTMPLSTALGYGFVIPYGIQNEMEDFATYTQIILWKDSATLENLYLSKSDLVRKKYKETLAFYNNLGLDLLKLQAFLHTTNMRNRILALKHKYQ